MKGALGSLLEPAAVHVVRLPPLPDAVRRIQELAADPEVDCTSLGSALEEDADLVQRVLHLAAGLPGQEAPPADGPTAAQRLGTRGLAPVVLQAVAERLLEEHPRAGDVDAAGLVRHALRTGRLACELARCAPAGLGPCPEEAFGWGLLHDVGKILLLDTLGPEYVEILADARQLATPLHVVERSLLGFSHVDVSALAAARWGLDRPAVEAIRYHHGPRARFAERADLALLAVADQATYRSTRGATRGAEPIHGPGLARLAGVASDRLGIGSAAFALALRRADLPASRDAASG